MAEHPQESARFCFRIRPIGIWTETALPQVLLPDELVDELVQILGRYHFGWFKTALQTFKSGAEIMTKHGFRNDQW
jgi:hypothetical protein